MKTRRLVEMRGGKNRDKGEKQQPDAGRDMLFYAYLLLIIATTALLNLVFGMELILAGVISISLYGFLVFLYRTFVLDKGKMEV